MSSRAVLNALIRKFGDVFSWSYPTKEGDSDLINPKFEHRNSKQIRNSNKDIMSET